MANLKEIRNRIASVAANMKITQAMKMVAASKFRRAADAITRLRPYSDEMRAILSEVTASLSLEGGDANSVESPYTVSHGGKDTLLVVLTSNKGLCGAFNANVVKRAITVTADNIATGHVEVITVGNKGYDALKKRFTILENRSSLFEKESYDQVAEFAQSIMDAYKAGRYAKVLLVYNRFKNAATQIPATEQFLPMVQETPQQEQITYAHTQYIFEPSEQDIIRDLIPQSLKLQLYKVLRESIASEHGARMTAMHQATDNAKTLRNELTLYYNKERQAAITNQIIEIASAANALENA